jgi:hypothetical protein
MRKDWSRHVKRRLIFVEKSGYAVDTFAYTRQARGKTLRMLRCTLDYARQGLRFDIRDRHVRQHCPAIAFQNSGG